MASEKAVDTHKTTRRRARPPDPQELLDQLEDVDIRLLQWLLRYPFQRAEDLALATGSSSATVYRHLNMLHNSGSHRAGCACCTRGEYMLVVSSEQSGTAGAGYPRAG